MLHLHFSNRCEVLLAQAVAQLGGVRDDPFRPDEVIVPSAAVQRLLTLAVARAQGVCAQVAFDWLAPWLWRQAQRLLPGLPDRGPLDGDALPWRVYAALGDDAFTRAHPRLHAYLGGADPVMRLQLAESVATLLGQYATYRADWWPAWRDGQRVLEPPHADEAWQAALTRRLVADAPAPAQAAEAAAAKPPATLADAAAALARLPAAELAARAAAAGLPPQVLLFALPTMPPLHLALLAQIARASEVHVYALNPCAEFWFEVVDARRLAWLAARGRAEHHEVGHPLLAAWGRQAQSQLGLLIDAGGESGVVDDAEFQPADADHLLARLQDSILDLVPLAPGSVDLAEDDRSLEVHVCHSLTRELEVLHDRLLTLLAGDDPPALHNILVLLPDLEAATPLIDAVFGTAPPERAIAYTVTGRTLASVNAPARALVDLLALVASRLPASGLAALLAQPVVARRFGLDDEALGRVQQWLREAGVHWALDDAHVAALGLPPGGGHTLADGLDRLFLGHALPTVVGEPFAGLLPAGDAEGSDALALGALWRVAQALARLQAAVAQPLPPVRWAALLADTLAAWVAPADDDLDALRELRQALQTLARRWQDARLTEPLPLDLVRQALSALLDDAVRGGVPTGAVTFSALPSLRGLPYRVVAVLGLNDGEFPAAPRPAEYDLLAVAPRRGDRQRRADDRNLFLDLLLSAREVLHLSCTGRSVRDNAPLPPSVLVDELLDHLEPVVVGGARARLRVEHPLQAFAEAPFRADADPRLRSHRADLAEALRAAARARLAAAAGSEAGVAAASAGGSDAADAAVAAGTEGDDAAADAQAETGSDSDDDEDSPADTAQAPFFAMPLPPPEAALRRVDLADWLAFFRHPQRFLLRRRLGLALPRADDELQDDEPFVPDGLARHALARRLLPPLLAGADPDSVAALARAGTELPAGAFGQAMLDAELAALDRHARRVRQATLSDTLAPLDLSWRTEIDGQAWQLDAALADLRPEGLVRERFGALRGSDVVQAWIEHLLLCAAAPDGVLLSTTWLARDAHLRLLPCDDAGLQLDTLMRLYARGLREPLPFFPRTAWAYLQDPARPDNLRAAQAAWQPGPRNPGAEGADPQIRLALRGRPDPLGPEALPDFHRTAHAVFDGVLACRSSDDDLDDGAAA